MRKKGIRAQPGYRTCRHIAGRPAELIFYLIKRNYDVSQPNKVWVIDITYIRTWEVWLYVAVALDLFSREVIVWAARQTIDRELVLDTILMAVCTRKPKKTIIHSDQGSQYSSDDWRRFCKTDNLEPSMTRRGNCWDNAVAEPFSGSLKKERIKKCIYKDRKLTIEDVSDYIDMFYNPTRRHQHLGGVSPDEFEAAAQHA